MKFELIFHKLFTTELNEWLLLQPSSLLVVCVTMHTIIFYFYFNVQCALYKIARWVHEFTNKSFAHRSANTVSEDTLTPLICDPQLINPIGSRGSLDPRIQ